MRRSTHRFASGIQDNTCSSIVPCLRRAASLQYTDADEDAERMVSASDGAGDGDEWVETHAGRKNSNLAGDAGAVGDIPDVDDGHADGATNAMANLSLSGSKAPQLSEIPDMDEIPDMEEDLEEKDEATAAPAKPTVTKGIDPKCVHCISFF